MAGVLFETVSQVVSDAALECGLASPADVFASTDANIVLMRRLLTKLGRDLVGMRQWRHLLKEATITTSNGDYTYDLPADFGRMVDQTHWNRTTDFPLGGPIDGQAWQYVQATGLSSTLTVLFRTINNEIWLSPTPTSTQTLAYEYITQYWIAATGTTTLSKSRPTVNTDILWFDANLLVAGLVLYFRRKKGLDTTAAEADFQESLERAFNTDGAAPVLSLNNAADTTRLLDGDNIPTTGYGS